MIAKQKRKASTPDNDSDENEDLGLDEYFDGDGVSVVEWAQFAEDELPDEFLAITFKRTDDESKRILTFDPRGQHFQQMVDQL